MWKLFLIAFEDSPVEVNVELEILPFDLDDAVHGHFLSSQYLRLASCTLSPDRIASLILIEISLDVHKDLFLTNVVEDFGLCIAGIINVGFESFLTEEYEV